jgi:threonine/homoserine/homoserine lactone efflux protein
VAAQHGFVTAFVGGTGRLVAFAMMLVLAATGLAVVLHASQWFFLAIKLTGAAYLIWLAVQLWRSEAPAIDTSQPQDASLGRIARQEFLVAAGNPKAILVFTAFLPQFVDVAKPMLPQFAVLGASFLVLEWVAVALYSWAGMYLGKWFVRAKVAVVQSRLRRISGGDRSQFPAGAARIALRTRKLREVLSGQLKRSAAFRALLHKQLLMLRPRNFNYLHSSRPFMLGQ